MVLDNTRSHLSKQLRLARLAIYQTQVIGGVQGNIEVARDITGVRKLKHRDTDSNRSTGGNKDYKCNIGRRRRDARLGNTAGGSYPENLSILASTHRPNPRRSKHRQKHRIQYLILRQKIGHDYDMMQMRCN